MFTDNTGTFITNIEWNLKSNALAFSKGVQVQIWNMNTTTHFTTFNYSSAVGSLSWSAENTLAVVLYYPISLKNTNILTWNMKSNCTGYLIDEDSSFHAYEAYFSPMGNNLITLNYNSIGLWTAGHGANNNESNHLGTKTGDYGGFRWHPDGEHAVMLDDIVEKIHVMEYFGLEENDEAPSFGIILTISTFVTAVIIKKKKN